MPTLLNSLAFLTLDVISLFVDCDESFEYHSQSGLGSSTLVLVLKYT